MRITDCEDHGGHAANAVGLTTGNLYLYKDNEKVIPVNARIEILD